MLKHAFQLCHVSKVVKMILCEVKCRKVNCVAISTSCTPYRSLYTGMLQQKRSEHMENLDIFFGFLNPLAT